MIAVLERSPELSTQSRPVRSLARYVASALGLLLIVAAGLKLYGLSISPVPSVGPLASPRWGIAIAAWELVLGLWLIAQFDRLAWFVAVITFTGFALASGYFGLIGVANCGCFGAVKASPWVAFAVDITALTLLLAIRPHRSQFAVAPNTVRRAGRGLALAGVAVLLAWGIAAVWFGSTEQALAALRGEKISLSTGYVDFGEGSAGDRLTGSIFVTNHSSAPLRIYGGTSDCSCTATQNLPLTIAPGDSAEIAITLNVPKVPAGQMTRKVWLLTDSPEQQRLLFRIGCRVY